MGFSEETIASVRGDSRPEIGVLLAAARPSGVAAVVVELKTPSSSSQMYWPAPFFE